MIAFASGEGAEDALSTIRELDGKEGVHLRDAAVVVRSPQGHLELHQTVQLAAGEGAVAGGAAGLVAGILLGIPVGGALVGILGGGGWGLRDSGIPDKRLRQLGRDLEPGGAVLCVLVGEGGLPQVRRALAAYGEVLVTGLEPTEP